MVRRLYWIAQICLVGCASQPTTADVRKMADKGDVEGLLSTWDATDRDDVRIAVLDAFAQHPSAAEGRSLMMRQATSASSQEVRLAAIRGLGAYEGAEVIAALVTALADPFPAIREISKTELAKAGEVADDPLLEALQQDPNHLVRASAARLLARRAKGPDKQLRLRIELAMLDVARKDDAPKVREAAVDALGSLGIEKARPVLVELMRTDGDSGVRMAAERSLGKLGGGALSQVVVAVLPFKNDAAANDPELARLGEQIAEYLAARLSSSKVCEVLDRQKMDHALKELAKVGVNLYDGDALNAPELGRFKMANQLVYGSVHKQGHVFTIVANRLDVSTLELVPGAAVTVSGYRADLEQLKAELTERFITNFR
jgi:TolB-like protein